MKSGKLEFEELVGCNVAMLARTTDASQCDGVRVGSQHIFNAESATGRKGSQRRLQLPGRCSRV